MTMSITDWISSAIVILGSLHTWIVGRIKARHRAEWRDHAAWLRRLHSMVGGVEAEHQAENTADRMRDHWAEASPQRQLEMWQQLHTAADALRAIIDRHHDGPRTRADADHDPHKEGEPDAPQ